MSDALHAAASEQVERRARRLVGVSAAVHGFAGYLGVLGAAAAVVGLHDASVASGNLGLLFTSVALVLSGALFLAAGTQLTRLGRRPPPHGAARPPCSALVLLAFLVAILVGTYAFFAAVTSGGSQKPIVIAVAVALVGVALLGMRFFQHDVELSLGRVGASIALGLAGVAIGGWEFWYQNQYVPSHLGRAVTLDAGLTFVETQGAYDVVRATLAYQDIGGRSVSVVGSTYTLTGSRVVSCRRAPSPKRVQDVLGGFVVDPQRSRFMTDVWEVQPASLLAAGKFVGDGKRPDANVPATRRLLFYVPRHRYQLLRLRAQLFAISASVPLSQRQLPEYASLPHDNDLYGFWHVADDSWLHDLLYGRARWVVTRYQIVSEPEKTTISPDFRVSARFPDPTWTKARPTARQLNALFARPQPSDSSEPFADSELALEPVAAPAPTDSVPESCR